MANDKLFKFKGKSIEELKALTIEEFATLIDSTKRRKLKRGIETFLTLCLWNSSFFRSFFLSLDLTL